MRIISIRKGFTSDHSSTSYEFLAVDKALGKEERAKVASLSSRAAPTSRRVSFVYNVDGYDIPGGWQKLMEEYYDVMYEESYDWWTFALAFNSSEEDLEYLSKYEFAGEDDLGIEVEIIGNRVIVVIYCRVNMAYIDDPYDYDEDDDEEEVVGFVSEDGLLNLLIQVRQQLMNRDYRTLYAVWEKYGDPDEEDELDIRIPEDKEEGKNIVEQFRNVLN